MQILIADDDRVIAQLIAAVVRKAGHVPLHAYDAMQTVMFASRPPAPHIIILDINMPGGSGLDALMKIKRSARTSTIPVIVVSGSIDQSLSRKVSELGATAFLAKPVDPIALQQAIETAAAGV